MGLQDGLRKYREKIKSGEIIREKPPSMIKAIKDNCKDCMGKYRDGRLDCLIERCRFYYWMPYGKLKQARKKEKKQ